MKQLVESFKALAEFQAQAIETDCIFFVTDTNKYIFMFMDLIGQVNNGFLNLQVD